MTFLVDKLGFAGHVHSALLGEAADTKPGDTVMEIDGMRLVQLLAGIMIETLLLFDDPDEGLLASIERLSSDLQCQPASGALGAQALPPSFMIDFETEKGRRVARELFEEWLDCAYEFHDLILFTIHNIILQLEENGQDRAEILRLFAECSTRALSYEIAAQELCEIVIEQKMTAEGWTFAESIGGMAAVAGRCLALLPPESFTRGGIDQISYVMTQEAVRLGVPAGSDWRFGLAANDCPSSAPFDLIFSLWPAARDFFRVINLEHLVDQAVACAKAAGRMLAVASAGEAPNLEPVIAKPLAMAAMTETYKVVSREKTASAAQI